MSIVVGFLFSERGVGRGVYGGCAGCGGYMGFVGYVEGA